VGLLDHVTFHGLADPEYEINDQLDIVFKAPASTIEAIKGAYGKWMAPNVSALCTFLDSLEREAY
jgi:hypothetical protein